MLFHTKTALFLYNFFMKTVFVVPKILPVNDANYFLKILYNARIQRGGTGGPDPPPEKSQ